MAKVVLVLSPNENPHSVDHVLKETLLSKESFQPLLNDLNSLEEGKVYVVVNPNASELSDILNIPDVQIVAQNHSIGEISRVSGDMFLSDKAESIISEFTRTQHQYKRMVTNTLTNSENVRLIEGPIGSMDSIVDLGTLALSLLPSTPTETVEAEPVPVQEEEPLIDFDAEEPTTAVEEPTPVEVEEPVQMEEPAPSEEFTPEPEPVEPTPIEPEPVPEETPVEDPVAEFDPMESLQPDVEEEPQPERSEPVEPLKSEDEFAAALLNSLEEATAQTEPSKEAVQETKTEAPARGIPETYPEADQTVTYDPNKLFKDSQSEGDQALYDWAANPKRFSQYHGHLSDRITLAMQKGKDFDATDWESGVFMYGEDQVSVPEMHNFQYVDKARWGGSINSPTAAVPIIMPIRNPNYGDAKYVGPESVSLLQNRMKIGCKLGVFLPHTGIYFIIVSPGDDRFLDTLSIINNQRIVALRSSSGILLGNSNFYVNRQVMNLFLDSIVHCSLGGWNREQLLKLIDERDINIIASALGASIYPDGYEYVQLCGLMKTDRKVCQHMTRKLVDLRRMVFVDNTRLSESQKLHAAGALKERSIKEIEDYQEANYIGYKKPYEITEGVEFVYRAQSAMTSIEAGEKWIKEIESIVDSIITFNNDEETRNAMIDQRISLTRIREYSHWVDDILVDGQPLGDRDKINKLLNSLSRNKDVVEKVGNTLVEFQRLASVAMVAVPRIKCPTCEQTDEKDLDISTHLIPQDAVSRLFTLVRQRL